jgi:hypothetical protein
VSGSHWADYYCEWLRALVPEFDSRPLYVLSEAEIPEWSHVQGAFAWTGCSLDLRVQRSLESRQQWHGRGPAIVVCDCWYELSEPDRLGILAHEAAHALTWWDQFSRERSSLTIAEELMLLEGGKKLILEAFRKAVGDSVDTWESGERVELECHGADFLRAALHLAHRARYWFPTDAMRLFNTGYRCCDPNGAVAALLDEMQRGGDIIEILKSEAPEAFSALYKSQLTEGRAMKTEPEQKPDVERRLRCPICWNGRGGYGVEYSTSSAKLFLRCAATSKPKSEGPCGHSWTVDR